MDLDRKLQLSILNELKTYYPKTISLQLMNCFKKDEDFNGNVIYLEEHGLVEGKTQRNTQRGNPGPQMTMAKITAVGLDFLEDDGGIRGILNKITIKIDSEDIQTIIKARLDRENVSPEKKNEILKTIKSLPSEGIKIVYKRLLTHGLDNSPDVIDLLQKVLQQ